MWQVRQSGPTGLKGGLNPYHYPLNPVTDTDPLGLFTCELCSRMIDETNNSLDNLPFNPAKMLTASLNTANSARLHTSGVTKLGIGIAADGFIILSPVGNVSLAWGNIKLATASYNVTGSFKPSGLFPPALQK
ncbi:hypothetical protein MOQ83_004680 [Salmonella enterica subsp. enterica serovar Kentucky]|nr:hypothetical protein [Salmonella enterica subsp. enterica serovar Kentucky]EIY6909306.1 hypothetical protein [Salmonella enterica subsp. enterica serovar Kentucky]